MKRLVSVVVAGFLGLAPLSGCGPSLSEKQLGEIQEQVPSFPAAEAAKEPAKEAKPAASQSAKPSAETPAESPK